MYSKVEFQYEEKNYRHRPCELVLYDTEYAVVFVCTISPAILEVIRVVLHCSTSC